MNTGQRLQNTLLYAGFCAKLLTMLPHPHNIIILLSAFYKIKHQRIKKFGKLTNIMVRDAHNAHLFNKL